MSLRNSGVGEGNKDDDYTGKEVKGKLFCGGCNGRGDRIWPSENMAQWDRQFARIKKTRGPERTKI